MASLERISSVSQIKELVATAHRAQGMLKSSQLWYTAMLGRTEGGGTGRTVKIIHWTSVFVGEPKEMQVGIRHLHQGGVYFRWREQPFILLNSFYILKDPSTYDATGYDNHKPRPQETLPIRESVDNLKKSCVVEHLANAARIDCAHGVV